MGLEPRKSATRPLSEAILHYLAPWQQLDWPVRWKPVFGRCAPLVVEIGFGNGAFLADLAAGRPHVDFVGIERAWGCLQRLFRQLDRTGLDNVRAIEGDAAFILEHVFGPGSIAELFINFPDPWPKERHHGRRLIQPAFVRMLAQRLVPAGRVTIATDHADYAAWIGNVLEAQDLLRPALASTAVPRLPDRRPTRYEQKALSAGMPIHYFLWQRAAHTPQTQEPGEPRTMPNIILEGAYDRDHLLADGSRHAWQAERRGVPVVVKTLDTYRDSVGEHRLVEMMVREGELAQHFGVSVLVRPGNRLLIKLSPMGHPRPTWGVKQAVAAVAQLLVAQHPGLRLVSTTVSPEMDLNP